MKKGKLLKIILAAAVLGVLLFGSFNIWLTSGDLTPLKTSIFKIIPYPLAFVNNRPVLMRDFIFRFELAEKLSQNSPLPPQNLKADVFNALISDEQIDQLAFKNNVSISSRQLEQEFSIRSAQPEFEKELQAYGVSKNDFKNYILRPELRLEGLKVWFNSQKELNANAYSLADAIIYREKQGESFASLAKGFSQDEASAQLDGDLGFVNSTQLLSELREPVELLADGEVKILPSREGLHIIKQEGQSGSLKHLRQIFLTAGDFEQWLSAERQTFKIRKFLKI